MGTIVLAVFAFIFYILGTLIFAAFAKNIFLGIGLIIFIIAIAYGVAFDQ